MGVKRYYCEDYEAMSQKAADLFLRILERNRKQMVCTATGASPTGMYRSLAEEREAEPELFSKTHIVPLDEWLGLPENSESSCHFYLQKHVVSPWGIAPNCYHAIDVSIPSNEVCKKIDAMLQNHGPLDICVLGIGKNGHLGLNEPADKLQAHCHIAQLSEMSKNHNMLQNMEANPNQGITLGMADILCSKAIILLLTGKGKKETVDQFLTGQITTELPASFLWLHPNVHCFIDKDSII